MKHIFTYAAVNLTLEYLTMYFHTALAEDSGGN